MLSSLNLVITIMSAAPIAQTDDISLEGVSVPLRLDYAVELENAISFIDQQRWADGIPILHRLAQSDGEAVFQFKSSHFVGIADAAITQLQNLSALGAEWYQNNFQHQAEALVNNFSKPLNLIRLEKTALLYSGLPASQQATHNLEQAYRDRNFHELLGFDYSPRSPIMGTESIRSAFSYQFDDTYPLRFQGHRVVTGHGLIYATNGHDVVALDQSSGAVVWKYDNHTWDGIDDSLNRELHAAQSQHTLLQPVLSDGILLVGIHLAKSVGRNDRYRNIDIRHMIPIRRLHAFDAKSGDLLWVQEEPTKENITREIAAGPPSVSAGRAYLPIYDAGGNVDVSLLCLDLYSGKKIFKTFLASGSMGTNLFGNLLTEVSTPQPLIHGKQLWMTTQLGTISCINTRTGHLKWTRTYPRSKVVVHQDGRVSQRVHHFGNNDLFYDNKVIAAAPLDSTNLLFLDANTGNTIRQLPAQARDDNNQHHLVSFDNELVTTSGNHTQQFKLRGGIPLVTSPRLYRYNGFSNENVLPPQLTVSNIWTPFEDGVSAAKRDDITKSDLQFYWGSLPGTAIGPIQAIDGSLLVLNRSGFTSLQCSDSIQLCLEQDYLSRRDLDYLLTFPAHDYRVVQNILKRLTDFLKRQPNLSIFDKELANLIIARCHLSLGNKAAALPILRKLKGAIDLDISWQAEVLFCQSVQIASDKLRSAPQRSAILISRNSVPAAALIAYLDTDWQILMSLYLDRDFENKELLKSWIEQIIKQHSKVFEVEQWLTQQLLQNESHPQRRAQLYKAAFEFTSKQFDQHQILLKATTASATVISQIDDASPQQLPTQWKLLHAFGDNDEILLFSSQQTLILVEGQDINYINPFGNRASVVSSLPDGVELADGYVVVAGNSCTYFDRSGKHKSSTLPSAASPYSNAIAVGNFVAYISATSNEQLVNLIDPQSGDTVFSTTVPAAPRQTSQLHWSGDNLIHYSGDDYFSIGLLHHGDTNQITQQQFTAELSSNISQEPSLGLNSNNEGELMVFLSHGTADRINPVLISEVQLRDCISRSFDVVKIKDAWLLSFIEEDLINRCLQVNLIHLDGDGSIISRRRFAVSRLMRPRTKISVFKNRIIISLGNSHFTIPYK